MHVHVRTVHMCVCMFIWELVWLVHIYHMYVLYEGDEQYCSFLYRWVHGILSRGSLSTAAHLAASCRNHMCVLSRLPVINAGDLYPIMCVTVDPVGGCFCYLDDCVRESVAHSVCRVEALWRWHAGGRL